MARDRTGDAGELTAASALPRLSLILVFSCHFILATGNTGLVSVLPAIGRSIGIPDAFVAATFSLSGLLLAIFSPIWARVSDRRGRKPMIIFGMVAYTLSMTMCGVVISAGLHHLAPWFVIVPCLLCARAIFGAFGSAIGPAGQAYIAERVPRAERTKTIASLAGAQGMGTIIGPLLAPLFILPVVGLSGPLFAFAVIAAVTTLLVLRFLKEGPRLEFAEEKDVAPPPEGKQGFFSAWTDPRLSPFLIYALVTGLAQGAQTQILAFLIMDMLKLSPTGAQHFIALAMMCGAIAALAAQWGFIRIFNMVPRDLMRWGAGAAFVGHLMMVASHHYWLVVGGYALSCLGFGFARPGFTAGMSLSVSIHEQSRIAGILAIFAGLNLFTPLFVMLYQVNGNAPFVVNTVSLGAMLIYCFRNPKLIAAGIVGRPKAV